MTLALLFVEAATQAVTQAVAQPATESTTDAASRIIQFAAILLEMACVVLIAGLFAIVGRSSLRRDYFTTWMYAWCAMMLGIGAITARYFFLSNVTVQTEPEAAPAVRALYFVYQLGKVGYWALICRGALEYAGQPVARRVKWLVAVAVYSAISFFASPDLNVLLVWQAPVAIAGCAIGARTLFRLDKGRRSLGATATATVLAATALLWSVYLVVFGGFVLNRPETSSGLTWLVLGYNSYADMLMLVTLGYAMLVLFMDDARDRLGGIETRMASLVRTAAEPILALDGEQRVIDANRAAARLFGDGARVVPGTAVSELVAVSDRERLREAIDDFAGGAEASRLVGDDGCLQAIRADGSTFTAEFTLSRLFDADVRSVSLVVRDVTARRAEQERRRQASTMEAVRQLAGGLAHDLNNLLTTIVGRSQIVARTLAPASPVREDVMQIEQAGAAASRLSRGLLALSRREPLDPERIEIDGVIRGLETRIRETLGTEITCFVQPGAPDAFAHLDRGRLEQSIFALVQNAREAIDGCGEVVIETSRAFSPHHHGERSDGACIVIRDTGPGLTTDARAHLFEPFFSTKADGRGLGLATAWAFVHQSGGTLDVESASQGTTFRIFFPLSAGGTTERAMPAAPLTLLIVPPPATSRRSVLLAEDEESVRKSVRLFLERAGITVVDAADGAEALAAFERAPDDFGLLLTDVMMPQMGGRELTLKVLERRPDLRIIFMSGFLRDPEVLRMVNDRRVRFLSKPFDVDALVAMVRGELEDAGTNAA